MRRIVVAAALIAVPACASTSSVEGPPPAAPAPPAAPIAPAAAVTAAPSSGGAAADPPAPPPAGVAAAAPAPPAAPPVIPPGTVVLHIGDSFALAGFAKAIKPHMKALGVRYEVRAKESSFTTTWSSRMERLVADTQPDLVIINLGANEVANVDPPAHAPAVRRIVAAIGGRPCVWVSAPSWRKDTGIGAVIRQNSAPCRYFDSDKLVGQPIPRQSDHIHPTDEGGAVWAEAFWSWLQDQRAPAGEAGGTVTAVPAGTKPPPPSVWRLKPAAAGEHEGGGG
jgi:lysophospholipase L1-like esterase